MAASGFVDVFHWETFITVLPVALIDRFTECWDYWSSGLSCWRCWSWLMTEVAVVVSYGADTAWYLEMQTGGPHQLPLPLHGAAGGLPPFYWANTQYWTQHQAGACALQGVLHLDPLQLEWHCRFHIAVPELENFHNSCYLVSSKTWHSRLLCLVHGKNDY